MTMRVSGQSPVALIRSGEARWGAPRPDRDPALTAVRAGVYAEREAWAALAPWERYRARVHAVGLVRPDAVFAYESAAALQALPLFGEPVHVHLFDRRRQKSVAYGDIAVHVSVDHREPVAVAGLSATSPTDTVLDVARVLPPAFALAFLDSALRRGDLEISVPRLRSAAEERRDRRGRRLLEWLWATADPASESVGESVSRAVIGWLGFPRPHLQTQFVTGGVHDRVDFCWPEERVIGESDGYGKYAASDADAATQILVREKRREDRLRSLGYGFARWDWADVLRAEPLRAALLRAGLRPSARENTAMLRTLARHPRSLARQPERA